MQRAVAAIFMLSSIICGQTPDGFDDIARRAAAALPHDPKQSAGLYEKAVALRPDWAEGWFYLGASRYQLKEYADARQALGRATSLAAGNGAAWAFLGLSEYELGDYSEALAHILKAELLPLPENQAFISTFRIRAAAIYIRGADYTAAIDQLRPLASAGDNSPQVIEAFGVSALTLPWAPGRVPEAKRAIVDLAGSAIWALYAQRISEASALFQELAAKYPQEPGVHYLCGLNLLERDAPAATEEFRKELTISPSHVLARIQIAILDIRRGDSKSALAPAREAARLAPENFLSHVALGRALLNTGQTAPAIQEFETGMKLAPANAYTHFYLGQAYRQAGRDADARREYAEFTALKAKNQPGAEVFGAQH